MVFVQFRDRREISGLRLGQFVTENHCDCLSLANVLSQFRPDAADYARDNRNEGSFAISICLNHAGGLLSTDLSRDSLADRFDLDSRSEERRVGKECRSRLLS